MFICCLGIEFFIGGALTDTGAQTSAHTQSHKIVRYSFLFRSVSCLRRVRLEVKPGEKQEANFRIKFCFIRKFVMHISIYANFVLFKLCLTYKLSSSLYDSLFSLSLFLPSILFLRYVLFVRFVFCFDLLCAQVSAFGNTNYANCSLSLLQRLPSTARAFFHSFYTLEKRFLTLFALSAPWFFG